MCIAAQAEDANPEPPRALHHAHRQGIFAEMAALKEEVLADNVQPRAIGIELFTEDPLLKELLSADCLHRHYGCVTHHGGRLR